jgi:hypothetical protein
LGLYWDERGLFALNAGALVQLKVVTFVTPVCPTSEPFLFELASTRRPAVSAADRFLAGKSAKQVMQVPIQIPNREPALPRYDFSHQLAKLPRVQLNKLSEPGLEHAIIDSPIIVAIEAGL